MVLEKFIKSMKKDKIAIIGLGYVGLPLARLFSTKFSVVGFDINSKRVSKLCFNKIVLVAKTILMMKTPPTLKTISTI